MTKNKQINFRASEEEHAALYKASRASHLPMSHMIRECIAGYIHKLTAKYARGAK